MIGKEKKLNALEEAYQICYEEASRFTAPKLKAEIRQLDVAIESMSSSLDTSKGLPSILLSLAALGVSAMLLFTNLWNSVRGADDAAATVKSIWGQDAMALIDSQTTMEAVWSRCAENNNGLMTMSIAAFVLVFCAFAVAVFLWLFVPNLKKKRLDEYRVRRAAYQQRIEDVQAQVYIRPRRSGGLHRQHR